MPDSLLVSSSDQLAVADQSYEKFLENIKGRIRSARARAVRAISTELINVYWQIGKEIERRQVEEGSEVGRQTPGVIRRLSTDLRAAFPGATGFSPANLARMRLFALAWPEEEGLAQGVRDLPWGHIVELVQRIDDREVRNAPGLGRGLSYRRISPPACTSAREWRSPTSIRRSRPTMRRVSSGSPAIQWS